MKTSDIAIVGMSILLPKISSLRDFWQQTNTNKNFFCPVPTEHWNHLLYRGICHASNGGFLDEIAIDVEQFGLKEQHIPFIDPRQLLVLECVRRCLEDARYNHRDFDRENTSVILACGSNSGALRAKYEFSAQLAQHSVLPQTELPEWSQHSYIGSLDNIISGRVAHCFGLEGKNFVVDACCASAMSAISIAISELQTGQSSVVVTGGVDTLTKYEYLGLDKTGVLSHSGNSRSFSSDADGSVISEGAAILLLKRKEDAISDGDYIHALIKGFGSSSNGKNKSLALPSPQHQLKALNRAYQFSGISPQTIEFIEGHGNATKIGDAAEAETIVQFLEDNNVENCALSTCKTTLGHTRAIAGVVGIIRTILALKYKAIPLHAQQENILPVLNNNRIHLPLKSQPWLTKQKKRCAGVNAFGFGGTNYHMVLEEYTQKDVIHGGQDWPWEILLFESQTMEELIQQLEQLSIGDMRLAEYAYQCCTKVTGEKQLRLAMVVCDVHMLEKVVKTTLDALQKNDSLPKNVFLQKSQVDKPKIAFLFNGQGSQCLHMVREMCIYLPQFQFANNTVKAGIMRHIFANGASSTVEINNTEIAQPALAMIHQGYHTLLQDLQIIPSVTAGHSFGEISALYCSGVLTAEQHFQMSVVRGQVMSGDSKGGMLSVFGETDSVANFIKDISDVVVANYNCPQQIVLSGNIASLEKVHRQFPQSQFLKVSHAFHSPQMQQAQMNFSKHIEELHFKEPSVPVYTNTTGKEVEADKMKTTISKQITSPVLFSGMIEKMYEDGVDIFLEIGPKNTISNLVKNIVPQAVSMAIDPKNGEIYGLLQTIAALYTKGADMCLDSLFTMRQLDLSVKKPVSPGSVWWVNGVRARKKDIDNKQPEAFQQIHRYFASLHKEQDEVEKPVFVARNDMNEKDDVMLSYQETMRKFLETQQQVMSLYLANGQSTALPLQENTNPVIPRQPIIDRNRDVNLEESSEKVLYEKTQTIDDSMEEAFLRVVANKTGYPIESLSLQHMIAEDLGIDSIKRVEIFEELKEQFAFEEHNHFTAVTLEDIFSTIQKTNVKNVTTKDEDTKEIIIHIIAKLTGYPQDSIKENHMLAEELGIDSIKRMEIFDALQQRFTIDEETTNSLLLVSSVSDIVQILGTNTKKKITRQLSCLVPTPQISFVQKSLPSGTFIFIGEKDALLISLSEKIRTFSEECVFVESLTPPESIRCGDTVAGLFYFCKKPCAQSSKYLFSLLKYLQNRFVSSAIICHFSSSGRVFSLVNDSNLFYSAETGIMKTFALENPNFQVKSIDIKDMKNMPDSEVLWKELLNSDKFVEVGYDQNQRYAIQAKYVPYQTNFCKLPQAKTILAIGGLRGITAEILRSIASTQDHLIIIGKSSIVQEDEFSQIVNEKELFHVIREREQQLSPALIHEKVQRIFRRRKRIQMLSVLEDMCAKVNYYSVDVANDAVFGSILDAIDIQHPKIDVVIHGAGIICDNLIANKSEQEFAKVFNTKVNSLLTLDKHISLRNIPYVVLFSSLASRFGNIGQVDYVAANELMNAFAHNLDRKSTGRVVSFNWGPWSQIGMAANLERAFREKKIQVISPQQGCEIFLQELYYGQKGDVEVLIGEEHE